MKLVDSSLDDIKALTEKMKERQPLPIGRTQFEEWSDRIISGAMVEATTDSLKFSLASMLMHLGPTEAIKEDGYFILSLRKAAVNQTAYSVMEELKKKQAEATAPNLEVVSGGTILEKEKF